MSDDESLPYILGLGSIGQLSYSRGKGKTIKGFVRGGPVEANKPDGKGSRTRRVADNKLHGRAELPKDARKPRKK